MSLEDWKLDPAHDHGIPLGKRVRSLRRESGLFSYSIHRLARSATGLWLRLAHRLRVEGRERLPKEPPFIIVANHTSHLDALVLATALSRPAASRVFPIAAGDVFFETTPAAVLASLLLNALPMWRKQCGRHALGELRRRLIEEPCGFILFPEGTRSRDGAMGSFKAGLGLIVAGAPIPVIPCYLEGCHEAWPPSRRWPRPGHKVVLRVGEPISFADTSDDRDGWGTAVERAEAAVRALAPAARDAS